MNRPPGFNAIDSLEKLSEYFPSIRRSGSRVRGIEIDDVEGTVKRIVDIPSESKGNIYIIKSSISTNRDATAYSILKMLFASGKRILVPAVNESDGVIERPLGKDDVLFLRIAGNRSSNEESPMVQRRLLADIWSAKADLDLLKIPVVAVTDAEMAQSLEAEPARQDAEEKSSLRRRRDVWRATFSAGFLFFAAGFMLMGIQNGVKAYFGLTGVGYSASYSNSLMDLLVYGQIPTSPYNFLNVFPFLLISGLILILISRRFVDRRTYRVFVYASVLWIVGIVLTTILFVTEFFSFIIAFGLQANANSYLLAQTALQAIFSSLAFALFIVRFASRKLRVAIVILSAGYVVVSVFQIAVGNLVSIGQMVQPGDRIFPSGPMVVGYSLIAAIYAIYVILYLKFAFYPKVIDVEPEVHGA